MRRLDVSVLVAGGGAVGWTVAHALAVAGARVTLAEPEALGDNASGVAAGMLAPAMESVFDTVAPHFDLLCRARDLWPALAAMIGLTLEKTQAMAVGGPDDLGAWEAVLARVGAHASRLTPDQAKARAPWLADNLSAVATAEDWGLDPMAALAALRRAGLGLGVREIKACVTGFEPGCGGLDTGQEVEAGALIVATGASPALLSLAPEVAALTPIKGHILRAPALTFSGLVVRYRGGYIRPSAHGLIIGATMEAGRDDRQIDPAAVQRLKTLATGVAPSIANAEVIARAGVRASTPDGLPLAGAGAYPGVWLAAGARRNGWLFAPLIAQTIVRQMSGEAGEARFRPGRFGPTPPPPV